MRESLSLSSQRPKASGAEVGLENDLALEYAFWFLAHHMSGQLGNLNQEIVGLIGNRYLLKANDGKGACASTSYVRAYFLVNNSE